jgi:uncharacterized protein (DUF433 family)
MKVRVAHPHVEISDALGGSPVIRGTRIAVRRLFAWHLQGIALEVLFKRYPMLTPGAVLDALAFGYDNRELIDADLARERAALESAPASAPRNTPTRT